MWASDLYSCVFGYDVTHQRGSARQNYKYLDLIHSSPHTTKEVFNLSQTFHKEEYKQKQLKLGHKETAGRSCWSEFGWLSEKRRQVWMNGWRGGLVLLRQGVAQWLQLPMKK